MIIRAFVVLFIAVVATSLGISIILPILPIYAKSMGATGLLIGLIFSSFAISKTIVNPFFGRLSDRVGKKPPIVVGLFLFTLVGIAFTWARNPMDLIVIRLVMGVANALVVPIVGAYIGELATKDNEAQYMAIFNISILIGMGIGPFMGGFLSDRYGMASAFYAMAAATAFSCIITFILLPQKRRPDSGKSLPKNPFKELIAIPKLRGLIVFNFITIIGIGGIMVFLPLLTKMHNITNTEIGILVSVIVCFTGILQVPFGRFADARENKVAFVITGAFITTMALFSLPFAKDFWWFMVIGLISAIGSALSGPAASALIIRNSRDIGLGFSVATFDSVQAAGFIVGPVLSGIVMDFMGINAVFRVSALIYLIGIWIFYRYTRM
ncbi:MAG: MFS transporter [Deltaproteobacteria bacterium]|nr:MFS transporter [Deltaproteobacteria bacterium]